MCWHHASEREKEWFELTLDETLGNPQDEQWREFAEEDERVKEAFAPLQKDIEEESRTYSMENIKQTVWLSGGALAIAGTTLFTHPEIGSPDNFLLQGMIVGFGLCLMMTFAQLWCGQRALFYAHKAVSMPNVLMKAVLLYGASVARGEADGEERQKANALWDKTRHYGSKLHQFAHASIHLSNIAFIVFELSMLALIVSILQLIR